MAYLSTSTLLEQTGITRKTLYSLLRRNIVVPPNKQNGRYIWQETHIGIIKKAAQEQNEKREGTFLLTEKRYYANKAKYAQFIKKVAKKAMPNAQSFADYFAGTGAVAQAFAKDSAVLAGDMLYSAYIFLYAWFAPQDIALKKITQKIEEYNKVEIKEDNYVSLHFAGTYFEKSTAKKIGYIREDIEQSFLKDAINERERAVLICSLLYAMDEAANIYAHYDTYKKTKPEITLPSLQLPDVKEKNNKENRVVHADANMIAPYTYADVVYLDPPMDSRQYGNIYHLPENIARWEQPALEGIAKKPKKPYPRSAYCLKNAAAAYAALVKGLRTQVILAAYPRWQEDKSLRSEAKLSAKQCLGILQQKGRCHVQFPPLKKQKLKGKQLVMDAQFLSASINAKIHPLTEGGVIVCDTREKELPRIASALNFIGGKNKQLDEILVYFPEEIRTFYDVFAGGGSVGINAAAQQIVFVDEDQYIMGLYQAILDFGYDAFLHEVLSLISQYNLSLTYRYAYEMYNTSSDIGLADANRIAYTRLRENFNARSERGIAYWAMFYVLITYGYNNTPRFNGAGEFNSPVGKRDFNKSAAQKLEAFAKALQQKDVAINVQDFKAFDIAQLSEEDFVFLDPPYLGASTYYNENKGWQQEDEIALFALLDQLELKGIRFMLYTVLGYQGQANELLLSWLHKEEGNVRVLYCEKEERNQPVLIINY